MHITFVALGQEQLAISLLSAIMQREGHSTSLAFNPALFDDRVFLDSPRLARVFDRTAQVVDEIVAADPDLVAFSVLTPVYRWSLAVASAVKQRLDVPVVFGGVHPSAVPDVCLENSCVDYVCVGEGDEALPRLVDAISGSGHRPAEPIPNMWWRDGDTLVQGPSAPFTQELDALPHWDKDLWHPHLRLGDSWMTMTARGCPYRCTFCFNNYFAKLPGRSGGSYLRKRSVEHVMEELVDAKQRWGIRKVDFQDDIFTTDKEWLRTFLREYRREIDVPFQCLVHPRYIDTDMARWLKDAGCVHVQMGVQSADEEYKRHQLLRLEKEAHMSASLEALRSADLDVKLDHILGLPGEPLSAQEKARELYTEFPPRRIQTFWLTHLPGVELTRSAVERGELSREDYEDIIRGKSGRFHTRSSTHAADAELYRRYELLFRAIPVLPRRIATRARVQHVPNLSERTANAVGLVFEAVNVVRHWDMESINYLRGYAHHLRRQLPRVVTDLVRRRATTPPSTPEPDLVLAPRTDEDHADELPSTEARLAALSARTSARPAGDHVGDDTTTVPVSFSNRRTT